MLPLGDGHSFLEATGGLAAGWAPAPGQVPQYTSPPQLTNCALVILKGTYLHVKTGLISLTKGWYTKVCYKFW